MKIKWDKDESYYAFPVEEGDGQGTVEMRSGWLGEFRQASHKFWGLVSEFEDAIEDKDKV